MFSDFYNFIFCWSVSIPKVTLVIRAVGVAAVEPWSYSLYTLKFIKFALDIEAVIGFWLVLYLLFVHFIFACSPYKLTIIFFAGREYSFKYYFNAFESERRISSKCGSCGNVLLHLLSFSTINSSISFFFFLILIFQVTFLTNIYFFWLLYTINIYNLK